MKKNGFTLIEILLVIGLIAILAAIVIVAINPARQFGQARDAQRHSDVNAILNAIHQYAVDNTGTFPSAIPTSSNCETNASAEICQTVPTSCTGLVNLSVLTNSEIYLVTMPTDPVGATTNGVGYHVVKSSNNRITVCAPDYEYADDLIGVTR